MNSLSKHWCRLVFCRVILRCAACRGFSRLSHSGACMSDGTGPWSAHSTAMRATKPDQEIPGPANRDPDSRFPAKSGIGDFPIPRPYRESGIPSPIPGKKSGIGADSGDPIPDYRVSPSINRSCLDSEYTQPRVSCQCSHRQHAAPIQGLKTEHAAASDEH